MLDRVQLERWLFGAGPGQRRVQDSPVRADVWYAYGLPPEDLGERDGEAVPLLAPSRQAPKPKPKPKRKPRAQPVQYVDLLLRPRADANASDLARALARRLQRPRSATALAFNDAYVACRLDLREMLTTALPLTEFWQTQLWPGRTGPLRDFVADRTGEIVSMLQPQRARVQGRKALRDQELPGDLVWLLGLVGRIAWERRTGPPVRDRLPTAEEVIEGALEILGTVELGLQPEPPLLLTVSRNRPVQTAVWRSRIACKVDAATQLFALSCRDVRWAVIDSGIDARHPAFARRTADGRVQTTGHDAQQSGASRVAGTWDFATIRDELARLPLDVEPATAGPERALRMDNTAEDRVHDVSQRVARGRAVDWERIAPLLQIHHDRRYTPPTDDHGTHVAGILAGDWRANDTPSAGMSDVCGICPDMHIYDLRAFNAEGTSDEFQILSAMQFVRHLNAHSDVPVVHGVNLSFSIRHDVDKYAAGATPVCEEAHRLIGSGVVVVAAAGNDGRGGYIVQGRPVDGYRSVSITDPGNAEQVITVGATHRDRPHTYGVSYFSSRGPTGDGRPKPDLVAPGESITSTVPGAGLRSKDGTSQAAPHVSGACALLLARHPELIGNPQRVKEILMATCTDLGRDRAFQGAGMIDVLRAIQSV